MDQLKIALEVLKKYHFWVLCGVVIVVGLAIWFFASAGLAKQFDERQQAIESKVSAAESIPAQPPNQETLDRINAQVEILRKKVYATWEKQYERQRKENPWPKELGDAFVQYVSTLRPPSLEEYLSGLTSESEIHPDYREDYWNYIQKHLPATLEIVDARLPARKDENGQWVKENPFDVRSSSTQGTAGYGGMFGGEYGGFGGMGDEMEGGYDEAFSGGMAGYMGEGTTAGGRSTETQMVGVVDISKNALESIRRQLTFSGFPSSEQVWLAQESLWVYESLLRIIAKTNKGATAPYNAKIVRIEALDIGQAAARAFLQGPRLFPDGREGSSLAGVEGEGGIMGMATGEGLDLGGFDSMGGDSMGESMMGSFGFSEGGDEEGGMGDMGGMGGMGGMGLPGEEGSTATTTSNRASRVARLLRGRYVDLKGNPVMDLENPPFAEFRLMPVRMLLHMKQTALPELLVNCANATMTVLVRQVRVRPGGMRGAVSGGTGEMAGFGGMLGGQGYGEGMAFFGGGMGDMGDTEGEFEGGDMMASFGSGGAPGGAGTVTESSSEVMPIEIQGMIFIFNPPDLSKLGTGTGTAAALPSAGAGEAVAPDEAAAGEAAPPAPPTGAG
ncbi:MAG TPA: hypothetical protein EYH34_07260, partial [Planctomycetes bacterium]|nr:hypothetical protein [Planctomycetota bacterium]